MFDNKQIIELHPEKPDQGEIRYTYSTSLAKSGALSNFLTKAFGVALGIGLLLVFIFFFVYVILPVIAILLVWVFARNLIKKVQ